MPNDPRTKTKAKPQAKKPYPVMPPYVDPTSPAAASVGGKQPLPDNSQMMAPQMSARDERHQRWGRGNQQQMPMDMNGLLQLINQGQIQQIQEKAKPVSRISKDQNVQRGTPGLDQWHRNNPNASQAIPGEHYGQIGPDVPTGRFTPQAVPPPAAQEQPAPYQGIKDLVSGAGDAIGNMWRGLIGGGGASSQQQAGSAVAPNPVNQSPQQPMGPPQPMAPQQPAPIADVSKTSQGFTPAVPDYMQPTSNMGQQPPMAQNEPMGPPASAAPPPPNPYGSYPPQPKLSPTAAAMGPSDFLSLEAPFSQGYEAFKQLQGEDRTVPLLNMFKAIGQGGARLVNDVMHGSNIQGDLNQWGPLPGSPESQGQYSNSPLGAVQGIGDIATREGAGVGERRVQDMANQPRTQNAYSRLQARQAEWLKNNPNAPR